MSEAKRATCPHCGATALRIKIGWWKRLVAWGKSFYHCRSCDKRFSA